MSSGKKKMEGNPDANLTSIGNYVFDKTLGEGNFAKVKLAKHKITGQEVAIKIIDKMQMDDKKLSKLYREVRIMKMLHNPNIVKLYEVLETKNTIFLVMEYVSGGELYDYLVVHGRMKEKEARAKFRQILNAVSYCHKKRVIHRDLKAENLLLDSNLDVKIADFGFSNQFDPDGKLDTFCGSPPYAAPELFQGKRYTGPEVDVWSLGVILYVLTTGCLPFDGKNLQEMRESVCRGKYRIPFYLSEGCEKLLRKFLVRDPTKRPSLDILIDDPWLNEGYDSSPIVRDINDQAIGEDSLVISIMESKFGVEKDSIAKCLSENVFDDIMAIYFLLYSEKMKNGDAALLKIAEQMAAKNIHTTPHANGAQSPTSNGPSNITVIEEEGASSENVVVTVNYASMNRRRPSIAQPPPAPSAGASKAAANGIGSPPPVLTPSPSAAAATATPTETPAPAVNPRAAVPVRRNRRATVSGEAEMKKIAELEKEDPDLLAKLKNMQVNRAEESLGEKVAQQQQQQPEQSPIEREVVTMPRMRVGEARPRPVSIAVPMEAEKLPAVSIPAVAPEAAAKPKVEGRKRTNTLTGFLKIRRDNPSTDSPNSSVANASSPPPSSPSTNAQANGDVRKSTESVESGESTDANKPRSLRFTFNSNTTSSKQPDDIVQEIVNSCAKNEFKHRLISRYLVECIANPVNNLPGAEVVKIEVEVCKLPRLKNLHGLKFKRSSGASSDYKTVCEQLLGHIQL